MAFDDLGENFRVIAHGGWVDGFGLQKFEEDGGKVLAQGIVEGAAAARFEGCDVLDCRRSGGYLRCRK